MHAGLFVYACMHKHACMYACMYVLYAIAHRVEPFPAKPSIKPEAGRHGDHRFRRREPRERRSYRQGRRHMNQGVEVLIEDVWEGPFKGSFKGVSRGD